MKTIMVVDDEQSLRKTVRIVLESEGYAIEEAESADECWKKLQTISPLPELILLDIRMPGMPSIELVKKVKENAKLRKIRIVYMTAIIGTKEFTKKIEGVIDAIEKPFTNEALLKVVQEAISYEVI